MIVEIKTGRGVWVQSGSYSSAHWFPRLYAHSRPFSACGRPFCQHGGGFERGWMRVVPVGSRAFTMCGRCAQLVSAESRRSGVSFETEHVFHCDRCKQKARTTPALHGAPRLPKSWLKLNVTKAVDDPDCVQSALGAQEFDECLLCSRCSNAFSRWLNGSSKK